MKATRPLILTITLLTAIAGLTLAAGPRRGNGWGTGSGIAVEPLTQIEIDHVTYMREEEKLARDVYQALAAEWDCPIFANISSSEQRHMDAVKNLIERHGLIDPVVSDEAGVFTNPDLQALYNQCVVAGTESLEAALNVGVLIEDTDIEDLATALAQTSAADVTRVFENLLAGSTNHLAAFQQAIETGCPSVCDGDGTCNLAQGTCQGLGTGRGAMGLAGRGRGGRGQGNGGQGNGGQGNGQQTRQRRRDGSCLATL